MEYNEEASKIAAQDPKIVRFLDWLRENGAIFDNVEFPAIYGQGLQGCRLTKDVK